ncbi:MAG: hypothetical protein AB7Q00_08740 [Phycisphaerales bacterium]
MTTREGPTRGSTKVVSRASSVDRLIEPKPLAATTPALRVDPLTIERHRLVRVVALWSLLVAVSAAPLLIPRVSPTVPHEGPIPAPNTSEPPSITPLNLASFDVPVWLTRLEAPPPAPIPEAKPTPPAPPPRLELVGIERTQNDDGTPVYRAVLYDLDAKRLLVVKAGDQLEKSARTIATVTPTALTITDGASTHTLALKAPPPMPPAKTK